MKKAIIVFLVLFVLFSTESVSASADDLPDRSYPDFGYSDYEIADNVLRFEEMLQLSCLDYDDYINSLPGACNYPNPNLSDIVYKVIHYRKNSLDKNAARKLFRAQLEEVIHRSPVVLVVDPNPEEQIRYTKTFRDAVYEDYKDVLGFTITSASIKTVLRNESSAELNAEDTVWLRESYWTDSCYMSYRECVDEMLAPFVKYDMEVPEIVLALIDPEQMEENPVSYIKKHFRSNYYEAESPLYAGDTLVFAEIDKDAAGATVLKINDLFKFKTKDPIKYDVPIYDFQKMIEELVGEDALTCFGLESNPHFTQIDTGEFDPIDPYYEPVETQTPTEEPTTEEPTTKPVPTTEGPTETAEPTEKPTETPTPIAADPTDPPTPTGQSDPGDKEPALDPGKPDENGDSKTPASDPGDERSPLVPILIGVGCGALVCGGAAVVIVRVRKRRKNGA